MRGCSVWLGWPPAGSLGLGEAGHMQWLPVCRWLQRAAPQSCRPRPAGSLSSDLSSPQVTPPAGSSLLKSPISHTHRHQQACASATVCIHFAEHLFSCPRTLPRLPVLPGCTKHPDCVASPPSGILIYSFPTQSFNANSVSLLIVSSKAIPEGVFSRLNPRVHYQLVVSGASPGFRLSPALSLGLTVTAEETVTTSTNPKALEMREAALDSVTAALFVLWDKARERGWLVRGDTVALHLLRVYLQKSPHAKGFDSTSLKHLGDKNSSAYDVLNEFNKVEGSLSTLGDAEGKPTASDDSERTKTREKNVIEVLGKIIDAIYALLVQLSHDTPTLNKHGGISGPLLTWFEERWSTTVKGWDFDDLVSSRQPQVYVYKMEHNPGWLRMTRELNATFLFAWGLGEILEPRAGSCCPYFPTLPFGKNFLASDMTVLQSLVEKFGGEDGFLNLPDKTVARLSHSQGWARHLDPFPHPNCRGDHLNTLEPSCFPVQYLQTASLGMSEQKNAKKDIKLLKDNTKLYTKGEISAMKSKHPHGVVVFGRQPGSEELKAMCRQRQENSLSGTEHMVNAAPTAAQASSRPSSRDSTPGSIRPSTPASKSKLPTHSEPASISKTSASDARGVIAPTKTTGQSSVASATRRAPSVSSIRSTNSSTCSKAPESSHGTGRPQASNPQTSAASAHRAVSNASLRSNDSTVRAKTTMPGSVPTHDSPTHANTQIATRKASNSSVRTTSSVASKATGHSNLQAPAGQQSSEGLKKITTNSSDKTTGSRSSGSTKSSAAGTTAAENRQKQKRLHQLGAVTATIGTLAPSQPTSSNHGGSSAGTTENPHPTSSGPDSTSGSGPGGS